MLLVQMMRLRILPKCLSCSKFCMLLLWLCAELVATEEKGFCNGSFLGIMRALGGVA